MSDPNELDYSDQSADDSNRTAAFLAGPHSPEDDDYDGTCVECDAPSGDASRCGDCTAAERRDRAYWNGREAHLDAAKESYVGGGR